MIMITQFELAHLIRASPEYNEDRKHNDYSTALDTLNVSQRKNKWFQWHTLYGENINRAPIW